MAETEYTDWSTWIDNDLSEPYEPKPLAEIDDLQFEVMYQNEETQLGDNPYEFNWSLFDSSNQYNILKYRFRAPKDVQEPVQEEIPVLTPDPEPDMVYQPTHYQLLEGVEVKDVREAILNNITEKVSYTVIDDWSRAWEYLTRMWGKNGLEDARKARVYLNWMITKMEAEQEDK